MATATEKSRAAGRALRRAPAVRVSEPMEFLIFEDNAGSYHWTLVTGNGATLARSGRFASYEQAELAARHVRDGAGSAPFERDSGALAGDLTARRAASDDEDPERWLAEDASSNGKAVAKWPAPH